MRALPSLLLAGAVGLGGLLLAPAPAEANGGWRGRDYYGGYGTYYAPPPRVYYGPRHYAPPRAYYRPPPPVYYRPPPPAFYAPPPAFYGGPRAFYGGPGPFYGGGPGPFYGGGPRSYGIPPGPGVGLFIR
jgi:hypothetical protein